ncbi:WD40 repeat-like protein [Punctularia strigosozonata HHB-11173 SS5]|uniref:WD40 repeat-like protein n=1 Tax=Punctularia strigosozonata (strain HHB-11173) TaxID=741275 RepID=UPI00044164A6|nr:WD40 repeat-like protein [Punctularia strigosozonata HHB-11173 SS5]EIN07512.1 WD40 repeat-like protein [Punctularia strigosozonata HHB-11173 SS5]
MHEISPAAAGFQKEARAEPKDKICDCHSSSGRNLVVCIDGTANQFGLKNTNVVELFSRLEKNKQQLTYYNSGIGTFVKESWTSPGYWRQVFNHTVDMAIAWNFKRIVLDAYRWLSEVYEEGDRIFLFGFSRGAYQIRVIAGMIEKVGLLHKGNNAQIPFAYEVYIAMTAVGKRSGRKKGTGSTTSTAGHRHPKITPKDPDYPEKLCANFKGKLSLADVKVHFVGAWDTVSSIGVARGPSLPETTNGMTHVCVFRHALALDELRVKFLPEYANGGAGPSQGKEGAQTTSNVPANSSQPGPRGDIKEVWFAGSHSDVGGGNIPNLEADQFGAALRWMTYEATSKGLRVRPFDGTWQPFRPNPSMSFIWRIVELIPLRRLTYQDRPQGSSDDTQRWPPHLSSPRRVLDGQLVHESVFELKDYKPRARLSGQLSWDKSVLRDKGMLETDPYLSMEALVEQLAKQEPLTNQNRDVLVAMASWVMDVPNIANRLFDAFDATRQRSSMKAEDRRSLERDIVLALGSFPYLPRDATRRPISELREMLSGVDKQAPGIRRAVSNITQVFGDRDAFVLSVAFSPDGTRIASGSWDWTIRIWAADTGKEILEPIWWHAAPVTSVAFSPNGGCLASGSYDCTVRLWNVETGQQIGEPLRGHTDAVLSVAFSPDGNRIVSGSDDRTLRLWDAQTRQPIGKRLRGHSDWVHSVVFSPDGKHIASASDEGTIRLWDAGTGKPVGDPLQGHDDWVQSVAYSPDGTRLVSASSDKTLRIWDTRTGKTVLGPLRGHTNYVISVAFSPDGKYVVSGSRDCTIRIWDAQTGQTVVGPLKAHTDWVNAVAFSPDGKRVVSGSYDDRVKIWDAEVD